jgi:hypothetical protein
MWWQPRDQNEARLTQLLPRLEELFLENRQRGNIYGVGTFLSDQFYRWWLSHSELLDYRSEWLDFWRNTPLLRRISLALFPSQMPLGFLRHLDFRYWYRIHRYEQHRWHGMHRGHYPFHHSHPLVLLNQDMADVSAGSMTPYFRSELPPAAQEEVRQWDLPDDTVFLFVSSPEAVIAAATTRQTERAIRCSSTGSLGTAGVRLKRIGESAGAACAFLTVGHMFPNGLNSVVEVVKHRRPRWLLSPRYQRIGQVVKFSTPEGANQPAYDAAVVETGVATPLPELAHTGAALTPPYYEEPVLGTIYGGVSGVVKDAGIVGTLRAHGDPKKMLWKNSWILVPSGAIVQGDSGSAFILNDENKVAGMVVGGSRRGASKSYMAQYVQDMASIQRDFLRPAGFSIA